MKTLLFKIPEYYILTLILIGGYSPPFYFNPIFLLAALFFVIQLLFKNKISGLILGILFFLGNIFFLGALISEHNEFTVSTKISKELITVGLFIWTLNFIMASIMIYKYWKAKEKTAGFA